MNVKSKIKKLYFVNLTFLQIKFTFSNESITIVEIYSVKVIKTK